ncbi:MAG: small ribosomal subunit biogenesis GTPase RsgA [Hahellaceae bacterium]|jgi:ribosome biogenesis GTPase|nr:small ribosomal subunit biogenesis GTPase RsgA [Hahellaceae bacterium]MCP5211146.1 small ribosomal subunit biogenesis GTPase RsgA [Hahellaceae bacterium]
MSKRKLNRQQKWRIEKIQQEKALRAEKSNRNIELQEGAGELSSEQKGVIISHYGKRIDVEATEGDHKGQVFRCHVRANMGSLVTGDNVIWRSASDGSGVIEALLPRKTILERPDNYGKMKPVASNIDNILIVIAPLPGPQTILIDRYLVAAETLNIRPVLLLNKTDLIDEKNEQSIDALMNAYQGLGYEIVRASATTQHGMNDLLSFLDGRVTVFVGQSGVGKSSLIQSLLPEQSLRIGELSEANQKGKHTTTTAKLFHLPKGGDLIDSPGIREFGLWHISEDELAEGFIEFRPFLRQCRFRNCQHEHEPGCGLLNAAENNLIAMERVKNYRLLKSTLNELTVRAST